MPNVEGYLDGTGTVKMLNVEGYLDGTGIV